MDELIDTSLLGSCTHDLVGRRTLHATVDPGILFPFYLRGLAPMACLFKSPRGPLFKDAQFNSIIISSFTYIYTFLNLNCL